MRHLEGGAGARRTGRRQRRVVPWMIPFRKLGGSLRFNAAEVEEWTKQDWKRPPKKTTSDRPIATPASLLALQHELYPSSRR